MKSFLWKCRCACIKLPMRRGALQVRKYTKKCRDVLCLIDYIRLGLKGLEGTPTLKGVEILGAYSTPVQSVQNKQTNKKQRLHWTLWFGGLRHPNFMWVTELLTTPFFPVKIAVPAFVPQDSSLGTLPTWCQISGGNGGQAPPEPFIPPLRRNIVIYFYFSIQKL